MGADTARLFFAAWPPPEAQQALGDLAGRLKSECGGRALPARNIHLTLVESVPIEHARLYRVLRTWHQAAGVSA